MKVRFLQHLYQLCLNLCLSEVIFPQATHRVGSKGHILLSLHTWELSVTGWWLRYRRQGPGASALDRTYWGCYTCCRGERQWVFWRGDIASRVISSCVTWTLHTPVSDLGAAIQTKKLNVPAVLWESPTVEKSPNMFLMAVKLNMPISLSRVWTRTIISVGLSSHQTHLRALSPTPRHPRRLSFLRNPPHRFEIFSTTRPWNKNNPFSLLHWLGHLHFITRVGKPGKASKTRLRCVIDTSHPLLLASRQSYDPKTHELKLPDNIADFSVTLTNFWLLPLLQRCLFLQREVMCS